MACCSQVEQIISFRFAIVTSLLITVCIFLVLFLMSVQYMSLKIQRYQARLLNHKGYFYNLGGLVTSILIFVLVQKYYHFDQIGSGPPVVNFAPINPSPREIASFYGLSNASPTKLSVIEPIDDVISQFRFVDVNRLLPLSDSTCPGTGACKESN